MTAANEVDRARELSRWSAAIGILMMIAGVLAIGMPVLAGIATFRVVAWMLALSGAGHLLYAWSTRRIGGALWHVLLALLYAGVGVYLLLYPATGLAALTMVLATYLFVEGVLELILASRMPAISGRGWFIFDGVVTLPLSLLIWKSWPARTDWLIGALIGTSMLSSGLARLMLSLQQRPASLPADQSTRARSNGAPSALCP